MRARHSHRGTLAVVALVVLGLALAAAPAAWGSGGRHGGAKKVTCNGPGSLSGYFELADGSEVTAKRAKCKTAKRVVKRFAGNCFKAYAAQKRCAVRAPKRWRCRSRIVGRPGKGIPARQKCKRRRSRVVFVVAYFPPGEPSGIGQPDGGAAPRSGPFDDQFKCIDLRPAGTVVPPPNPRGLGNFEIHVLRGPVSVGEELQVALVAQRVSSKLFAGLGAQPLSNPDRVPIFVTDRRFDAANSLGVHAPTCQYPNEDAIVVRTNLGPTDPPLAATGGHELFHAHSSGVANGFFRPWWEEASATWAEGKLGFAQATRWNPWLQFPRVALDYQPANPSSGDDGHQYAMWRFVQFLDLHGLIGDTAWPLQRQVIHGYPFEGATVALSEAITSANSSTSLGAQLAAFWGGRLEESPLGGGPTLKPVAANANQIEIEPGKTEVPATAGSLQTSLLDFKLSNQVARVELEFDPPTDGYFWGLVEKNDSRRFRKNGSVTFCVGGPGSDGELEWPGHFPVTFTNGSLSTGDIQGKITVHAQADEEQCRGPTPNNRACEVLAESGVSGLLGPGSFPFFTQDRDEERAVWNCFYTGDQGEVNLLLQRAFRLSAREVRQGVRRQIESFPLERIDGVGDIAGFGVFNDGEKDYGILVMAVGKENVLMTIGPGGQRQDAITLAKRIAGQIE